MPTTRRTHKTSLGYVGARDNWICWICLQPVEHKKRRRNTDPHRASIDHVIPRSEGGRTVTENLRLAHQSCNAYRAGALVAPFSVIRRPSTTVPTTVDEHYFQNL